jgi:hypothetical protein
LEFVLINLTNTSQHVVAEPLRFGLLSHAAIEMTYNYTSKLSGQHYHPASSNTTDFWTLHNTHECVRYDDQLQSTQEFATAQLCAIVCVVLGGILSWMMWIMYCCRFVCLCIPSIIISLGFLVVLPVLQGTTLFMVRQVCHYRLDEPPLQDLVRYAPADFQYARQESTCGMSSLYGLYYPVSIALWIVTGILFLAIRPKKDNDLSAVFMLR